MQAGKRKRADIPMTEDGLEGLLNEQISSDRSFSLSVQQKKDFFDLLGVDALAKVVLGVIRARGLLPTPDLEDADREKIWSAVDATRRAADVERLPRDWKDSEREHRSPIFLAPPVANTLSTILSGAIRYRQKIEPGAPSVQETWDRDAVIVKAVTYICTNPTKREKEALSLGRIRVFAMQGHGTKYPTAFPICVGINVIEWASEFLGGRTNMRIVDPCAGWGDRLTASCLARPGLVAEFHAMDPWSVSRDCCRRICAVLEDLPPSFEKPRVTLRKIRGGEFEWAEDVRDDVDLVFTSPPYGDLEQYALGTDETDMQAWRYMKKGLKEFASRFLEPMLTNARRAVAKRDGLVIINVNDYGPKSRRISLIATLRDASRRAGLEEVAVLGMSVSVRAAPSTHKHQAPLPRAEPIFVYRVSKDSADEATNSC